MNTLEKAAQQALEALMWHDEGMRTRADSEAITALRAALAQQEQEQEQEPVAHFGSAYVNENGVHITTVLGPVAIPQDAKLYTHPPRREWQSLKDEEMHGLYRRAGLEAYYPRDGVVQYEYERRLDEYARAIEQACKERNND
jgi:hypothetical protein